MGVNVSCDISGVNVNVNINANKNPDLDETWSHTRYIRSNFVGVKLGNAFPNIQINEMSCTKCVRPGHVGNRAANRIRKCQLQDLDNPTHVRNWAVKSHKEMTEIVTWA